MPRQAPLIETRFRGNRDDGCADTHRRCVVHSALLACIDSRKKPYRLLLPGRQTRASSMNHGGTKSAVQGGLFCAGSFTKAARKDCIEAQAMNGKWLYIILYKVDSFGCNMLRRMDGRDFGYDAKRLFRTRQHRTLIELFSGQGTHQIAEGLPHRNTVADGMMSGHDEDGAL